MWPLAEKHTNCALAERVWRDKYPKPLSSCLLTCLLLARVHQSQRASHLKKSIWSRLLDAEVERGWRVGLEAQMEHDFFLDHILSDLFTLLYIAGFCLFSLLYSALLWKYILTYPFYCGWTLGSILSLATIIGVYSLRHMGMFPTEYLSRNRTDRKCDL